MAPAARRTAVAILALLTGTLAWWLLRPTEPPHGAEPEPADAEVVPPAALPALKGLHGARHRSASAQAKSKSESPAQAPAAKGWHLVGTVKDPEGKPIPDAEVRLALDLDGPLRSLPDVRTDPRGSFSAPIPALDAASAPSLEESSVVAWALAAGWKPFGPRYRSVAEVEAQREIRFEIVLTAGASLRGRVLDSAGKVVSGAAAVLCATDRKEWSNASADALGRFAIAIPRTGPFWLHAEMNGVGVAVPGELQLAVGRDMDVGDLVLRGEGWLEGRCVYPDGTPAVHLPVGASPPKGDPQPPTETCWTETLGLLAGQVHSDAAGRFRIAGLKPGRYVVTHSTAVDPDHGSGPAPIAHETGDADVVVVCRMRRLLVRVVDREGRPVPGASLEAEGRGPHGSSSQDDAAGNEGEDFLETEPGMKWEIKASSSTSTSEKTTVVTPAEPWETTVTLVLSSSAGQKATGTLRVSLERPDGRPVTPVLIEYEQVRHDAGVTMSYEVECEEGTLTQTLDPGQYSVTIRPSGPGAPPPWFLPETGTVVVTDGQVTTFAPKARVGGRLRVTLRDRGGTVPENALLHMKRLPDGPVTHLSAWEFSAAPGSDGQPKFAVDVPLTTRDAIEPGRWKVRLEGRGVRRLETLLDVEAGKVADGEVLVEPE